MIFLVRHGEAAAGWGDHPDPALSGTGLVQARSVASELSGLGATAAVCSPMLRCRETARAFEDLTGTIARVDPAVSEIVTPPEVRDRGGWLRGVMSGDWPEHLLAWREHAFAAVDALPSGTAVFSHFVAINAIVSRVLGDPRTLVFRPGHCSVTVLGRDGGRLSLLRLGEAGETRVL